MKIIKIALIIIGVIAGLLLITFLLGIPVKNSLLTSLVGGIFAFIMQKKEKIKENDKKLEKIKDSYNDEKKKIINTNFNNYNLATDPANNYIHERIQQRRNKKNNK